MHSETYRMLNGMCRNAIDQELEIVRSEDEDEENVDGQGQAEDKKKRKMQKIIINKTGGEKTLEKESNLNLTSFDT